MTASPVIPGASALSGTLLSMQGIQKAFAGVKALDDASLSVESGEVHALIGQNGAGKSTLIKVLTGAYRKDGGSVTFAGASVDFASPLAAQHGGIATIYQEINLVPLRSVAENIFLGREPRKWGLIQWRELNAEAARLLSGTGPQAGRDPAAGHAQHRHSADGGAGPRHVD